MAFKIFKEFNDRVIRIVLDNYVDYYKIEDIMMILKFKNIEEVNEYIEESKDLF